MQRQLEMLQLLADGHFHSGETIACALGISRAAVWKTAQSLEDMGVDLYAVRGRGYRLARPLELLDAETIAAHMGEASLGRLQELLVLPQVDSTNGYLLAKGGHSGPCACLAEHQRAGRGRRGRQWVSPFGSNLYVSLLWPFDSRPLGGLSLAVAVAVMRALRRAGAEGLGLKWPNDVLWRGRKLAGILLEMTGEADGPMRTVIGIGLNLFMPLQPGQRIDQPWTDLAQVMKGQPIGRNQLAGGLLHELVDVLGRFETAGMAPFLDEWAVHDLARGNAVQLHLPTGIVEGVAQGIDGDGALLVSQKDGIQRYFSGEVSLRFAS